MDEKLRLLQIVNVVAVVWIALRWIKISRLWMKTVEATLKPESVAAQALECLPASSRAKRQRTEKGPRTRTPDDCPHYCGSATVATEVSSDPAIQVVPYSQLKTKLGRPKRSLTGGYCCHNPECDYQGIQDSGVHALVADGVKLTSQGLVKQIKCQWCGSKFLVTRDTAMCCRKLSVERVGEINRGLAEGLSISACARVFGHSRNTIHRLVRVSGDHFQSLHELLLHGIHGVHVQMDEFRAKLKGRAEAIWTWVSMEASNKLMLVIHVGQRTQANAYALDHKSVKTLAKGCIPTYASDGLKLYYAALVAHHGRWVDDETLLPEADETGHRHRRRSTQRTWCVDRNLYYGQVIKRYARRKIKQIQRRMVVGSRYRQDVIIRCAESRDMKRAV